MVLNRVALVTVLWKEVLSKNVHLKSLFCGWVFCLQVLKFAAECGSNSPANVPCRMVIIPSQLLAGWALFKACDKKLIGKLTSIIHISGCNFLHQPRQAQ